MGSVRIALILILGGACGKAAVAPQEPSESPAEPAQEASDASTEESREKTREASEMHERFLVVNAMRDAVIAGDLAAAQERARHLANDDKLLHVLADWGPHTENIKKEARLTAEAADLGTAAVHTAAAARACGRCHDNLGVATVGEEAVEPPAESDDIGGIMRRHYWSVSRLWEGLIGPSEMSWQTGAQSLAEITSSARQQPEAKSDKELPSLLSEVDKLATEATQAVTFPERTQVLGQLLSTCSTCHEKMNPGASPGKSAADGD